MNEGHRHSVSGLAMNNSQPLFGNGSVSSGSPMNSPLVSPAGSPFLPPGDNSWDQLQNQFSQQMSLQPPQQTTTNSKSVSGNTFVHKLYNMVVDKQYQHLIAWTYTGTSFIVCNITEFSRDVLPKHFKHNNFSSFVRQLNMYGFHKVNKSPRGHRTLAENQIWEFSHLKFLRNRPDLLDEIKRKALESESMRRDNNDINSHMAMMQMAQTDLIQQLSHLQENFTQVMRELAETRRRQNVQQQMMKEMMDFISKQYGGNVPIQSESFNEFEIKQDPDRPPSIYITSADSSGNSQQQQMPNFYLSANDQHQQQQPSSPTSKSTPNSPTSPRHHIPQLSVQTQNLNQESPRLNINDYQHHQAPPVSPSLSPYQSAVNTPLPPSPCPSPGGFLREDENTLYSPRSPLTPNSFMNMERQQQFNMQSNSFNS